MAKFTKDPQLDTIGSWQVVINMFDKNPGTHFWAANARSINTQITPDSFGALGMVNTVYHDGTAHVYNQFDSTMETDVKIIDGEWHLISYKVFTLENGDIKVIMLVDGEDFVDKTFEKGDTGFDFEESFSDGYLSFYFMDTYDIELKAAPADTPEIIDETQAETTPTEEPVTDETETPGDAGTIVFSVLILLSSIAIIKMKKKVRA